ncbi:uncharacterized protein LOC115231207 [Argonauta hians]
MMSQLQVLLFRDSFSTPWGIRLQGGKDLTSPLLIQRVFPNSPAVGYLQRGDILLSINGKDASALSHKEAQDIFQSAGGQIPLLIRRINIQEKNPPQQKPKQHQSYRTVPLDFEGPTSNMAHPHVPKGGMKYGGGGPIYGVNYAQAAVPAPVQRQSSKPWEDNEMLYKVQDTLSHISYPHQIGSYNGEPPQTHYQHVPAPPAYVPGPPPEPETYYVDPFPTNAPVPQQEEDEEYEFLPVSQRRNQFNKQDFVPDARKPIKPRSRPPSFKAPAPAPAPRPVSAPMHQPVYAPVARPAEGQVVSDEAPAWAGTLSSASGAKMWDAGYHPGHNVSPTRSVSPPKKAGKQHPPPAPRNPQEFSPTKTQALDFSNDPDDGPRIMHLQYNSPLGMYSNENVQETLQGQTQAALGGGNTAAPQKKVPAHERDWTQSELLRMIHANEETNEPKSPAHPPVQSTPRPAASPPKRVVQPPPPPSPKPVNVSPVPPAYVDVGVSDF